MSFDVADSHFSKIEIADLARFLTQQGFENFGHWGRYLQRYSLETDHRTFDVLLPKTSDISDFRERMRDAIYETASALNTEPTSLIRTLAFSEHKVFKIRARPGMEIASLPYEEGIGLIENAWKMIKSSAVAAMSVKPKKVIRGKISDSVQLYMEKVRLGQTEVGSFVFNFILPQSVDLVENYHSGIENVDPVSDVLNEGISFADEIRNVQRIPSSARLADTKLSANFFEAMYALIDWSDEIELQVAGFNQVSKSGGIRFDRSDLSIFERTAERLAPEERRVKQSISGTITRLSEPAGKRRGSLDLLAKIENRRRTVQIRFEPENRDTIIRAFKEKDARLLTVSGFLRTQRNGHLILEDARDFDDSHRGSLL